MNTKSDIYIFSKRETRSKGDPSTVRPNPNARVIKPEQTRGISIQYGPGTAQVLSSGPMKIWEPLTESIAY